MSDSPTQSSLKEDIDALSSATNSGGEILRILRDSVEKIRCRGEEIPANLLNASQLVATHGPWIVQKLREYARQVEPLVTPGHLPADLARYFSTDLDDNARLEAGRRIVPYIRRPLHPNLWRKLEKEFRKALREENSHLSFNAALELRLLSCLAMAREVFETLTVNEFNFRGRNILQNEVGRRLPKDILGNWYSSKSASVEEADPEQEGKPLTPDRSIDTEKLLSGCRLTETERKVVETAAKLGSEKPKDIACHLGISVKAVRVHLCNARKKIRQKKS